MQPKAAVQGAMLRYRGRRKRPSHPFFLGLICQAGMILAGILIMVFASSGAPTPQEPLQAYRLDQLEIAVAQMRAEHGRVLWLLVGNLVAIVASLLTYMVTSRRKRPRGGDDE